MVKKVKMSQLKWCWIVSFLVLWELMVQTKQVDPLLMPSLKDIAQSLLYGVTEGDLLYQLAQSIIMILLALILSLVLALLFAYLDYFYTLWKALFEILSAMLDPLPGLALLPLVILWVGIGSKAVFVIIVHGMLWSMYLNIKQGFASVSQELLDISKNAGAGRWQTFFYVLLPSSGSALRTGILIGWSRGWRSLISAEMIFGAISSIGGIGWYIYERRSFMDTKGVYAGVFCIVLIGILVEKVFFGRFAPSKDSRHGSE